MHIVQILPSLNEGGVERGTIDFNKRLSALGHKSTVISSGGLMVDEISNFGGNHINFNSSSKNLFTFFKRTKKLKKIILDLCPDIIHARSRVPAWMIYHINMDLGIPFVTTVHGFNSINFYSKIMTKGDRVIYGSHAIKNHIIKNYNINHDKLFYIPRGVDVDYFNPEKCDDKIINNFKSKYDLKNKKIISIIGRISPWKGHDDFIKSLAKIQKKYPNIKGLIVGSDWSKDGTYLKKMKNLALNLDADICFAGTQSNIREIYKLSDIIVSASSSKPETFGRISAESLAMNTPVIASAHGGTLDIIKDNENGFLFKPGDINDLIDKIELSFNYSFSNMRDSIINNFSLDNMTTKTISLYEGLLSNK